ncbi:MAG: thymidylate synthase [Candidatus Omnitrophica bacterium]|nr:thymidylate synthase [Candidatus Omnitrophota bacterium]
MKQYLDLVKHVLANGDQKQDRTGTGTVSVFGHQMRFDLREGFPIVTTKKILFDAVVWELLWFLRGSTNINDDLVQHTPIWNAWAREGGELGPVYGYQWRKWEKFVPNDHGEGYHREHIDQISQAISMINKNPDSRRIIVTAWNPADIEKMALPPCHAFFQFYVVNGHLDCQLYQRSADIALGVPFNISSYALLLAMVANECCLKPRYFVHTLGDAHVYANHVEGLKIQLERKPKELPRLYLEDKRVLDYKFDDIRLSGYTHDAFIKFPIAV